LKATVAPQREEFHAKFAQQQKQIEALSATVQKVSDQMELAKPAPPVTAFSHSLPARLPFFTSSFCFHANTVAVDGVKPEMSAPLLASRVTISTTSSFSCNASLSATAKASHCDSKT
jgi:hypothetical protein